MSLPLYQIDAFTDRPFAGNPAAVCLLDGERDAAWMQAVAAEMNLSETAFLRPLGEGEWSLRWFTPATEVPLCGHATLASAHALWEHAGADRGRPLRFHTASGVLTMVRGADGIAMDFPRLQVAEMAAPAGLAEALGAEPGWYGRTGDDWLVMMSSAQSVRELAPDLRSLAALDARGIIVTAAGDAGFDMLSRVFAPRVGIDEDPVTGSVHCALAPFWANRLGRARLRAFQASRRGGELIVEVKGERVSIEGQAITVFSGELHE